MSVIVDFLRSIAGISETKVLDPEQWQLDANVVTIKIDQVPALQRHGGAVCLNWSSRVFWAKAQRYRSVNVFWGLYCSH